MKNILTIIFLTICITCFAGEIQPTIKTSTTLSQNLPYTAQSAWRLLLSYEGKDLSKLDKPAQSELEKSADVLLGDQKDKRYFGPRYLFFSKISDLTGKIHYILFDNQGDIVIPGDYKVNIYLFNREGKFLNTSSFSCGWRMWKINAQVTTMLEIGRDVLMVNTQQRIGGLDTKEYYALVGNKILLIRLEDARDKFVGQLIRNMYGAPNISIGLTIKGRSADDWVKALESKDVAELLATLTWLSGIHLNPKNSIIANIFHEDLSEAQLVENVRSRKDVQEILHKLLLSENPWVREAVELTQKVEYFRQ